MLSSSCFTPTPYPLPAAQCGTQDSQGRTIMPALVPVTAERLEPHGLFLLENGFVCDRLRQLFSGADLVMLWALFRLFVLYNGFVCDRLIVLRFGLIPNMHGLIFPQQLFFLHCLV
jgi:hypothetical protein